MTKDKTVTMSPNTFELGFDYVDGKHIPTVKISLNPCHPDDNAAWEARNLLAEKIKALLAAPVVERQEPVMKLEAERLWEGDGEYSVSFVKSGWLDECRRTGGTFMLYTSPPAPVAVDDSTTSDKYRAELYDEVWQKARDMGFANVTDALERLDDIDGCPRLDKVKELNR